MPITPSDSEDEYFKRQELHRVKRERETTARKTEVQERERLKELHWMRCPKCGMELAEIAYRDVHVDACFACGGMYLDYGEVEKILEFKEPGTMRKMMSALFGSGPD
jgi:hypothetical protein